MALACALGLACSAIVFDLANPEPPASIPLDYSEMAGGYYWQFKRWPADENDLMAHLAPRYQVFYSELRQHYKVQYRLRIRANPTKPEEALVSVQTVSARAPKQNQFKLKVTQRWFDDQIRAARYFSTAN